PHPALGPVELAKVDRFWPTQVFFDAVIAAIVIGIVAVTAARSGAPLEAPADPASTFTARPEWYFLFLFQLLKYFEGPLEVVGTIVIPGLASVLLIGLPLLDRAASRRFSDRKAVLGGLALAALAVSGLTALAKMADARDPQIAAQKKIAEH